MNSNKHAKTFVIATSLLSLLLAGCTHMINPPKQPFAAYPAQEKFPLRIALNITDELRAAKWEKHSMGDTWIIPIGNSIAQNAAVLARQSFTDVVDITNGRPSGNAPVDAMLTPKVAYITRTTGATSFGESIVAIKVEWSLNDAAGKNIWVDTVSGQGSGSTGWTNPETILKKALEDVLTKSQRAISSAEAIRQFTVKQHPK